MEPCYVIIQHMAHETIATHVLLDLLRYLIKSHNAPQANSQLLHILTQFIA